MYPGGDVHHLYSMLRRAQKLSKNSCQRGMHAMGGGASWSTASGRMQKRPGPGALLTLFDKCAAD